MKNYVQPGTTITLIAPAAVKSGEIVNVGAFVGVAAFDAAAGQEVETMLEGVFELPKGSGALAQGSLAYWEAGKVADAGDLLIGAVTETTGATATTVRVRLNGVTS